MVAIGESGESCRNHSYASSVPAAHPEVVAVRVDPALAVPVTAALPGV